MRGGGGGRPVAFFLFILCSMLDVGLVDDDGVVLIWFSFFFAGEGRCGWVTGGGPAERRRERD